MPPSRVRTPSGSEDCAPRAQRLREQPDGRYGRRVARRHHRARDLPAAQAVASAWPPAVVGVVRPCSARSVRLAIESGLSAMAGPRRTGAAGCPGSVTDDKTEFPPSCMPAPADAKGRLHRSASPKLQGEDGAGLPRPCVGWNMRGQNIRMRIRGMSIHRAPSCPKRESGSVPQRITARGISN